MLYTFRTYLLITILGLALYGAPQDLKPIAVWDGSLIGRAWEVPDPLTKQPFEGSIYMVWFAEAGPLCLLNHPQATGSVRFEAVESAAGLSLSVYLPRADKQALLVSQRNTDVAAPVCTLVIPKQRWVHLGLSWEQSGGTKVLTILHGEQWQEKTRVVYDHQPNEQKPSQLIWLRKGVKLAMVGNEPVTQALYP